MLPTCVSKVTEYTSTVKCATEPRSSWRREWWEPVLEPRSRLSEQGRGQATTSPRDGNTCTREVGGATASVFDLITRWLCQDACQDAVPRKVHTLQLRHQAVQQLTERLRQEQGHGGHMVLVLVLAGRARCSHPEKHPTARYEGKL